MSVAATSIYAYDKNCTISKTTKQKQNIKQEAIGERAFIAILEKYGFLTMPLIKAALRLRGHKRIDAEKSIDILQKKGIVDKYTITHTGQNLPDNDVYVLSEATRKKSKPRKIYRYNMDDIPYILEHLTLAQWHLAIISKYKSTELMYNHKLTLTDGQIVTMPSLVRYANIFNRSMNICAIPVCKGLHKADLGAYMRRIILLNKYFNENVQKYRNNVFITICESTSQITEINNLLVKVRETAPIYMLYAMDFDSAMEEGLNLRNGINPLNIIYRVTEEENGSQINLISIR